MVFDVYLGGVPVCHDLRGMAAMPQYRLTVIIMSIMF